ncbi:FCD domain-containing protein [Nocardioides dubius]
MRAMGTDRARETVRRLRFNISSGVWPVNSKIPNEADLAAEFNVGRSTIREAVRSLANLGMLEPAPGRGTFVRSRTPVSRVLADFAADHELADLLQVRRAIEVEAARAAAAQGADVSKLREAHERDLAAADVERGHMPGQFHALLVSLAGNSLLDDLYVGLMVPVRAAIVSGRLVGIADDAARQHDHGAILDAIEAGDPAAAAVAAGEHADRDLTSP